jgi:hypothetical protein
MTDVHREEFLRALRTFAGGWRRHPLDSHEVEAWWIALREYRLDEVLGAFRAYTRGEAGYQGRGLPSAASVSSHVRGRWARRNKAGVDTATRSAHYVRPGDERCRRCLRPVSAMVAHETCPPSGSRLRLVEPVPAAQPGESQASTDARMAWYAERDAFIRGEEPPVGGPSYEMIFDEDGP